MRQLSPRLQAVADLVAPASTLFDIGTDHAYLPIYCLKQGLAARAVAIDKRSGPLVIARRNIERHGLSDRIETRQNDGLKGLKVRADDCVVIAGLGALEIQSILDGADLSCPLVIQPQRDVYELRRWLSENSFSITSEKLPCHRGRFYPVIRCLPQRPQARLDDLERALGPLILQQKPAGFAAYCREVAASLRKQVQGDESKLNLLVQITRLLEEIADDSKDF